MRSACIRRPGSRIAMASTAAGHAYTAALDENVGNALLAEMEREIPEGAKLLRPRIWRATGNFLREHGYVVACGLWSPHINGLAVPLWSPQYQTFVVVTIGLLSAMYDEKRLHKEVAPRILELSARDRRPARRRRWRTVQRSLAPTSRFRGHS